MMRNLIVVMLVVLMAGAAGAATVAQWRMNEGSGLVFHDDIGDNDAQLVWGGGLWSTDSPFEPDPTNGSYDFWEDVLINDAPELNPSVLTIECWVNFDDLGGSPYLVSKRNSAPYSTPTGYFLEFWAGDTFGFATGDGTGYSGTEAKIGQVGSPYENMTMEAGVWYHVAAVHTGTENILYVNGISNGGNSATPIAGNTDELNIGSYARLDHFVDALMDDVRLSDVALDASQLGYHGALDIPEPATMLLLGLGSLALYRKRS